MTYYLTKVDFLIEDYRDKVEKDIKCYEALWWWDNGMQKGEQIWSMA